VITSPPVGSLAADSVLSLVLSFPVGGIYAQFDVYSMSLLGTFDTLLASFNSPKADELTTTSGKMALVDMEFTICLPKDAVYGIGLRGLSTSDTATNSGRSVAVVRNISLTNIVCMYSQPVTSKYAINLSVSS
jgi:hypothetical protein